MDKGGAAEADQPRQVTPYLMSVYTERTFRLMGAARAVVKSAVKWCRDRGYERVSLHASDEGRHLYETLGFERTHEMRLRLQHERAIDTHLTPWNPGDRMASLKETLRDKSKVPPIMTTLGMHIVGFEEGLAQTSLKVDRRFHNPMGTLHGGIMTDLADACMGIATITTLRDDESFTTLELKMNFLRSMVEGELTAEAKVLHRGRTIAMTEVILKNHEGKGVARGSATQMILRPEIRG